MRGIRNHPLYNTWFKIKGRCKNPKDPAYKDYGGRGINVGERWLGQDGFINFCEDMGPRPERYTVERVNNNGNYEPSNCIWATRLTQAQNRRMKSTNKTGVEGVSIDPDGGYRAVYKTKYLGIYSTVEQATKVLRDYKQV